MPMVVPMCLYHGFVRNMSCLLWNSQVSENFSSSCKDFLIINRLFFHNTFFIHPIFKLTWQILSTYIFLTSKNFCSRWYSTTQQHFILQIYVLYFFYRIWKGLQGARYRFEFKLIFLTWNIFNKSSLLFIVGKYLYFR